MLPVGGQTVSQRGICYSVSPNPTIDNSCSRQGNGLGTFTASNVVLNVGERNIDDTKAGRLSIKSIDVVVEGK